MKAIGTNLKKIRAVKRDKESFFITETQAAQIEQAKHQRDDFIKIIDKDTNKVVFWGDPKQIIEFKEDYQEVKKQKLREESEAREREEKAYWENDAKKKAWSQELMKQPGQLDAYKDCVQMARQHLDTAIEKEWVGSTFVNRYGMCLWRQANNCPYK